MRTARRGGQPSDPPRFFADEGALLVGIRALTNLAVDYLALR